MIFFSLIYRNKVELPFSQQKKGGGVDRIVFLKQFLGVVCTWLILLFIINC